MNNLDFNSIQQATSIIVFLGLVFIIFAWSGILVVYISIQFLLKKAQPKPGKRDLLILSLGLIGVLCVLYGFMIEPYWLSIEHVPLKSRKLKADEHIRVVQISDVHSDPKIRLEEKLPDAIAQENPDIIVFTGDAINSPEGLPNFRNCLQRLAKIAPTFVVKGNWDSWYFKDCERFGGTGAQELTNTPASIRIRDVDVVVAGVPVGTKDTVANVMKDTAPSAYRIFLFHYPDFIEDMEKSKVDLYLAGHTHGGQVALPLYGALITLSARGKQFESGLHKLGDTYEYTNRGIGMEGGKAPRVRFCARPEVTVFDVSGLL